MKVESLVITPEILRIITEIDEFKGTWRVLGNLAPEQLRILRRVATIESIGSSTRIEGSKLSDKEVEALLSNIQISTFESRDEQEVAGYAGVMNTIFDNYEEISLTENYIKQLHRDLLKYSNKDERHRGEYKKHSNQVEAFDIDGKSIGVVFVTASPFDTPLRMERLISWTRETLETKKMHPLLTISVFIVEFLAIHPFQDGNGRLSRVLTTYLLLKFGYIYTPYVSLESIIEQNKQGYYLALRQTQGTLGDSNPNWHPWTIFFLKALLKQKQKLSDKLEKEYLLLGKLPKLSLEIMELVKAHGQLTISDITTLTKANRNTIKKHIEKLAASGQLQKHGTTKGAYYTR
jgi:Fic family protein